MLLGFTSRCSSCGRWLSSAASADATCEQPPGVCGVGQASVCMLLMVWYHSHSDSNMGCPGMNISQEHTHGPRRGIRKVWAWQLLRPRLCRLPPPPPRPLLSLTSNARARRSVRGREGPRGPLWLCSHSASVPRGMYSLMSQQVFTSWVGKWGRAGGEGTQGRGGAVVCGWAQCVWRGEGQPGGSNTT
jgi:hypothetical protein